MRRKLQRKVNKFQITLTKKEKKELLRNPVQFSSVNLFNQNRRKGLFELLSLGMFIDLDLNVRTALAPGYMMIYLQQENILKIYSLMLLLHFSRMY